MRIRPHCSDHRATCSQTNQVLHRPQHHACYGQTNLPTFCTPSLLYCCQIDMGVCVYVCVCGFASVWVIFVAVLSFVLVGSSVVIWVANKVVVLLIIETEGWGGRGRWTGWCVTTRVWGVLFYQWNWGSDGTFRHKFSERHWSCGVGLCEQGQFQDADFRYVFIEVTAEVVGVCDITKGESISMKRKQILKDFLRVYVFLLSDSSLSVCTTFLSFLPVGYYHVSYN